MHSKITIYYRILLKIIQINRIFRFITHLNWSKYCKDLKVFYSFRWKYIYLEFYKD